MVPAHDKDFHRLPRAPAARLLGVLLAAVASACATAPVRVAFDPGVDFAAFRTFAVTGGEGIEGTSDARLAAEIAEALERRGLAAAAPEAADLRVRWRGEMHERTVVREYVLTPIHAARHLEAATVREGRLSVVMADRTSRAVWEGTAEGVEDDRERARSNVLRSVRRLLEGFPPGPTRIESR
jgi:hypothetical protein